ncbi:uncharacterized protein K444DRAFT_302891 [Hyaloscypha bicolor E]|uniref:Uncharacterized protein n=1 Tax=Hyaloscypha bicolor E TaxID=1095630 RepID=A0A2J6TN96_9HELO|nr:uncharacterized protein K444DRAFT_302891 [Hyaloscypha bicolor E]PMD64506.1 hypothetical protein K444DRAFT_302891 [Hyaloscypha bicolor E]
MLILEFIRSSSFRSRDTGEVFLMDPTPRLGLDKSPLRTLHRCRNRTFVCRNSRFNHIIMKLNIFLPRISVASAASYCPSRPAPSAEQISIFNEFRSKILLRQETSRPHLWTILAQAGSSTVERALLRRGQAVYILLRTHHRLINILSAGNRTQIEKLYIYCSVHTCSLNTTFSPPIIWFNH